MRIRVFSRVQAMLPAPVWLISGVLLYAVGLALATLFLYEARADRTSPAVLRAALLSAACWWPLLGTRPITLLYELAPLRTPGRIALCVQAWALHVVLGVALPMAMLYAVGTGLGIITRLQWWDIAAAFWLGWSCSGVLFSATLRTVLMPLSLLGLQWVWLPQALTSTALAAFLTAALIFQWSRLRGRGVSGQAPIGTWFGEAAEVAQAEVPQRQFTWSARRAHRSRSALASVMGPDCQTLMQRWGATGLAACWAASFLLAAGLWALGKYVLNGEHVLRDWMILVVLPVWMLRSQSNVHRMGSLLDRRCVQRAELFLLPGLPQRQHLNRALLRQSRHVSIEKVCIMAPPSIAALQLSYALTPTVLGAIIFLLTLCVAQGQYRAWMTLHGKAISWLEDVAFSVVTIGGAYWLTQPSWLRPALWIAALFIAAWVGTIVVRLARLRGPSQPDLQITGASV